jgi:glyceraldehyde 3-phosphate dehydrogenase
MGRLLLREAIDLPELEFVLINEIACDAAVSAHLLKFDSIHGRWSRDPVPAADSIRVDNTTLAYTQHESVDQVPWDRYKVDVVFECTGAHRSAETLRPYLLAGVKKVVVAAPVKDKALADEAINIVMGINEDSYEPGHHNIVTAASCTTNCLAPVVKVIRDGLGISHGVITTIHDLTNTQSLIDQPHSDPRRARASMLSLIPTSTGSATAIGLIYPELEGKLSGIAVRVPVLNASLTDCVFEVKTKTSVAEVNELLKSAAEGPLKNILGYEERPLVSVDYVNDPRSAVIDAGSTMVVDQTQVKILAWYDNEFGYVKRMAELGQLVARTLK